MYERVATRLIVRDAQPAELDEVAMLLGDVYGVFRDRLPADAWSRYIGEIVDVAGVTRAQQHGARAIGLHTAFHLDDATRLYTRLGFRRARQFDIEIGEMFGGRGLSPDTSWQAQAYRLDLKGALT